MRIAGIIAEYNPFHNGHAWHIAETRRLTGCDYVVVALAGHFTQRGEPAILSKWDRARMAMSCGADAVFELPALFAVRTADAFARGGVGVLGGVGVDVLSFGCETEDMVLLRGLARLRESEPTEVSDLIRANMAEGMAHVRARGEALGAFLGIPAELLNRPNMILAAEYLREVGRHFPGMDVCPVLRCGDYHNAELGLFSSASAIRAALNRGQTAEALSAIPEAARPWAIPDALHPMDDMLLLRLREMSLSDLAALPDVAEGLEHRLYRLCRETAGREALLEALKCKRYTRARLSRLLTHALLGLTQADVDALPRPAYARLLGARRDAEPLLRELSWRTTLPVVSNATALRDDAGFRFECRATDVWALLHDDPGLRLPGREFTEKFVRLCALP